MFWLVGWLVDCMLVCHSSAIGLWLHLILIPLFAEQALKADLVRLVPGLNGENFKWWVDKNENEREENGRPMSVFSSILLYPTPRRVKWLAGWRPPTSFGASRRAPTWSWTRNSRWVGVCMWIGITAAHVDPHTHTHPTK